MTHAVMVARPTAAAPRRRRRRRSASAAKAHQGRPRSNPTTAAIHARHSNPTIKDLQSELVSVRSLAISEKDSLVLACFQLRVIACLQTIVKDFQDGVHQGIVVWQLCLAKRTSGLPVICCV